MTLPSSSVKRSPGENIRIDAGALSALISEGGIRLLRIGQTEVLRRLSYPIRDAIWGTIDTITVAESLNTIGNEVSYQRAFKADGAGLTGQFNLQISVQDTAAKITAKVEIKTANPLLINRAGFAVLHPLDGVAGTPLIVRHPDGSESQTDFPSLISPDQPAKNIAGLAHKIGPISVDISFEGDVFEMEDQRNWSDASYKTYCRPLSAPRPFMLNPDEPIRQSISMLVNFKANQKSTYKSVTSQKGRMPEIAIAHESGLSNAANLSAFNSFPVLARITEDASDFEIAALANVKNLTLELVAPDLSKLESLASRCKILGLHPAHVVALPKAYLASHQPEGPWPEGATPDQFAAASRELFPDTKIGAGSLTNFTEFNRCRPNSQAVDFITFGNTAIVHAADDMSVIETLEALPHIFASAKALAGGKPLRLGLFSIAMRSNPYGAKVAENPQWERKPMAQNDPRQGTGFAAAYAVGVLAAAASNGIQSIALAMPDGPLGASADTPLRAIIGAAAKLAKQPVSVTGGDGWVSIKSKASGLAANFKGNAISIPEIGTVPPFSAIIFGEV